jgi:hypothetical protein
MLAVSLNVGEFLFQNRKNHLIPIEISRFMGFPQYAIKCHSQLSVQMNSCMIVSEYIQPKPVDRKLAEAIAHQS